MMNWKTEQVTKLNAAERQIKEAIRLFFERRDSISIHTLVGAASQILYDISKSDIESMRNSLVVKDEGHKLWRDILNKAINFSKHADKDPNAILEFNQEMTVFLISDALSIYIKLTNKVFPELMIFNTWFGLAYPEFTKEGIMKDLTEKMLIAKGVSPYSFEAFSEVLSQVAPTTT